MDTLKRLSIFAIALAVIAMTSAVFAEGEGYDPMPTGGAGGDTVTVTNVDNSGAGSLRQAILDLDGSATIIEFSVAGVICPTSEIRVNDDNVTIDGSSAPNEGITISGASIGLEPLLGLKGDNVIVKHLRFRDSPKEGIQVWDGYKVLIDHCSVTGSEDGAIDINNGTSYITISRTLFGGNVECHRAYGESASLHHNLYAWNNRRQPKIVCYTGPFDFRNNLVEYWTNTGTNIAMPDGSAAINIKNNYYGPPAPTESWTAACYISAGSASDVYTNGNAHDDDPNRGSYDVDDVGSKGSANSEPNVTTHTGSATYSNVLADVGASPTDAIDSYYINGGGTSPPDVNSCGLFGGGGGGGGGSDTFYSEDTKDGTVRESSENSGVGDWYRTTYTYIGDTSSDQQYIGILSFDTSDIPDDATITEATLTIRRLSETGDASNLGAITVDIKEGYYGSTNTLKAEDFAAASTETAVATLTPFPSSNGNYADGDLDSDGRSAINLTGLTQFKIRFASDDNDDSGADYLNIYDSSSNASLDVTWE